MKWRRQIYEITGIAAVTFLTAPNWWKTLYLLVTTDRFILPGFSGADLYHYIARARSAWNCEDFSRLISRQYVGDDGLMNYTERVIFGFNCAFDLNDYFFAYYVIFVAILSVFLSHLTFYLLFKVLLKRSETAFVLLIMFNVLNNFTEGFHFQITGHYDVERWPTPSLHYFVVNSVLLICIKARHTIVTSLVICSCLVISIHLYFYSWQITFVIVAIFITIKLLERNFKGAIWGLVSLCFAILLSLNYFMSLIAIQEKTSDETFFELQVGYQQTHEPRLSLYIIIAFAITLGIWIFPKSSEELRFFSAVVGVGALIVYNQNVLTGILIQEGHYFWYFIKPYSISLFLLLMFRHTWNREKLKFARMPLIFSSFILIGLAALKSLDYVSPKKDLPTISELQKLPTNIYSFEEITQYYLSYNTNGDFAPISNMTYYPRALTFVRDQCLVQLLWENLDNRKGNSVISLRNSSVCSSLIDSKIYTIRELLGEAERLSHTQFLEDWISSQGIRSIVLDNLPSQSQEQLLKALSFNLVISDLRVWSKE